MGKLWTPDLWLPGRRRVPPPPTFHKQRGNIVMTILPGQDPLFNEVTLLLYGDEAAHGAQAINSTVGPQFSAVEVGGSVASISNVQSKFGSSSLWCQDFTGANESLWKTASDFLGAHFDGDFTIEFHVYFETLNGAIRDQMGIWSFGSDREWRVQMAAQTLGDFRSTFLMSTTGSNSVMGAQKLWGFGALQTWYHFQLTRSGSNFRHFVDGNQVGSTDIQAGTMFSSSRAFQIGGTNDDGPQSEVFYANVRFTKGSARNTTNFTPPNSRYPDF